MTDQLPIAPKSNYFYAALAAGIGLFCIGAGTRILPLPGDPKDLNEPLWLIICIGLAFFCAGVAIFIQTIGHANAATGDLPPDTPRWLRALQYVTGLMIAVCLAAVSTWVAFGPGERHFTGTFTVADPATNAVVGRTIFGVGTVIMWLCAAGLAAAGFRKLFDDRDQTIG